MRMMKVWIWIWIWICLLTLARLSTARDQDQDRDQHRAAGAEVTGLDALFSDSEPPVETRSGGRVFTVPVWKFVKERADGGPGADGGLGADGGPGADLGRPQFRCSHGSVSVRFSLVRHSDLKLGDGRRLLSLPDECGGSVRIFGPWLLLKMPDTSCHVALWSSAGSRSRRLDLRYFDRLLRRNVTGVAACHHPATAPRPSAPLVTCGATGVTVKLPLGSRLHRVKAPRREGVAGRAVSTATAGGAYVRIPTAADTDSVFELLYVDAAGETSSTLMPCFRAESRRGPERRLRALQGPDLWELWDFDEVPLEPYDPEATEPPATEPPTAGPTDTTTASDSDSDIFSLWGFDEIPDGPFTGDPTTSAPSTTTVGMTTTTTAAPTSTTTTTSSPTSTAPPTSTTAPPTSTTAPPSTTASRTTTRPHTTTRMTPTTAGGVSSAPPSPAVTATTGRMTTSRAPWTGAM